MSADAVLAPAQGAVVPAGPPGPPPTPPRTPAYEARWRRVMDCIELRQPDRMPTALFMMFWPAKYAGISCKDVMYDRERVARAAIEITRELDPDLCCPSLMTTGFGSLLDATGYRQIEWPGHSLPDDRPFQFLDREYMLADEYDDFLFDPTGFYYGKYLPRVAAAFDGSQALATMAGATYFDVVYNTVVFADPRLQASMTRLFDAGRQTAQHFAQAGQLMGQLAALGYPSGIGGVCCGPYDNFGDYFRGATAMMKDLYRRPAKVLQALDKMMVLTLRRLAMQKPFMSSPLVFIPVHWAPDAFMSQKQFETFWWPSFRELMLGIIEMGLIPMPLWEADCTKRLETIRDVPPGKCLYWFERTDMVRAREVLGDVVALRGGMHPSLMTMGTPQEVETAVARLVDEVWAKGGKLILDTAFGIPDETPLENARAMYRAARKYGGG
jgi:Uroporphyrinogen decarboxylase (URO-D)